MWSWGVGAVHLGAIRGEKNELIQPSIIRSLPALGEHISLGIELLYKPFPDRKRMPSTQTHP